MFGRKKPTLEQFKEGMRPTPDADGVTRVFPKALWDDPKVGDLLRQVGMNPDDPRNRVRTAQDHLDHFARRREALMARTAEFNRESAARYGHCNARPMLIIAPSIWDGEHGAFLYGQLDLCGYDEWNILMCAGDRETIDQVGLIGHPGEIPALTEKMTAEIVAYKATHGRALDAFGRHVMGDGGMSREDYDHVVDELRASLLKYVDFCRGKVIEIVRDWH